MSTYIIGIDPGLTGGIAFLRADGGLIVIDMPTTKKKTASGMRRVIDRERLRPHFDRSDVIHVALERQGTRPGQAAGATFVTGANFGLLEGLCLANYHPYTIIAPQTWKRVLSVPRDKTEARGRASELMPGARHKWANAGQDGRAEAALIALYAAREILHMPIAEVFVT